MRVVYRSPAFPQLRGNCFVGLYETGALAVFAGHPAMPGSRPVWNTDPENQLSRYDVGMVSGNRWKYVNIYVMYVMYVYIYIACMYICMYVCIYVEYYSICMYVNIHMHVCLNICLYVCMYVCMLRHQLCHQDLNVYECMYVCM